MKRLLGALIVGAVICVLIITGSEIVSAVNLAGNSRSGTGVMGCAGGVDR